MQQNPTGGHGAAININIAVRVHSATYPDWYKVRVVGEVVYPLHMVGQVLEIRYMDLRNAFLNQRLLQIEEGVAVDFADQYPMPKDVEGYKRKTLAGLQSFSRPGCLAFFYACERFPHADKRHECWRSRRMEYIEGEGERAVMQGLCRVVVRRGDGTTGSRDKAHVDILQPELARRIENDEDLRRFFAEYISPVRDGWENNANCVFRIIAPKMRQVMLAWVYAAREWVEAPGRNGGPGKRFSVPASALKTWEDAIFSGAQSNGLPRVIAAAVGVRVEGMSHAHQQLAEALARDLAAGEIFIEAIPGQRIRIISGDMLDLYRAHAGSISTRSNLAFAAASCVFGEELRFVPMCGVALIGGARNGGNRGKSVAMLKLMPDFEYRHYEVKEIPTKHYLGGAGGQVSHAGEEYSGRFNPGGQIRYRERDDE